ncbi:hypothetical protein Kfla_3524 [Kribbella flavida DSM 17836]|uniref:Uncharacterized protein n=1 Tax=Kribbella flavida (strain DSM 17836 / JCM 10339 / NBRC 14399) TaxID=479435 RepID=D2PM02_KRIFD|nr:hypothetical protein Kfla_3524 [Kribbella flavida DSM 17836]
MEFSELLARARAVRGKYAAMDELDEHLDQAG